ncbi:MAG: ubiquitin [Candidatus Altiarchaeota archaeon]|nr:ubiquitin [Candidatus Altiarchaeota archaeon]
MDMRALAKQLKTKEISARRVIFETEEGDWIFENPKVIEANMMGQIVFQVFGKYELLESVKDEDLTLIMEKTNCTKEQAKTALEETKDIAEAIIKLS